MFPPYVIFRSACFAFFFGVLAFSIITTSVDPFFFYIIALACAVGAVVFRSRPRARFIALLAAAFFIGSFRIVGVFGDFSHQREYVQRLPFITIWNGVIITEPRIQESRQSFIVEGGIREAPALGSTRVYVTTGLAPRYHIGDRAGFGCKKNPNTADSGWFNSQRITAYCGHPKVIAAPEYQSSSSGLSAATMLERHRVRIVRIIERWIPAPHAQLIAGILVGDRTGFSREISLLFAAVGISHIVAISGYNITVLILAVAPFVRRLRVSRIAQTVIFAISIALFTVFTGASSATVRAAFMGVIALVGLAAGRKSGGIQALTAAAAAMVFIDPLALYYDRGFQLSCAATAGLIILSPALSAVLRRVKEMGGLKAVAIQTFCATIGTLPILLIGFGSYSPIALVANLFVVPLIPVIMAVSFAWMMGAFVISLVPQQVSFAFDPIIQIASLPVWALAEYIFGVSRFFASLPVPRLTFENSALGIGVLVALYSIFGYVFQRISTRARHTDLSST
ncbi:ComEC/Rec2 family competence protein [Candidatus Uhrbacteria bacterium]|nr:ComEC/Rec2 family competence protein [Candidatus Uhrbacteria bacterium]